MAWLKYVSGSARGDSSDSGRSRQGSIAVKVYVDTNDGRVTSRGTFIANKPFWAYDRAANQPNVLIKFTSKPAGIYKFIKSEFINGKKYHYIEA